MELSDEEYAKILADVPAACKEIAVEATVLFERKEERLAYFMLRQIPAATQDFVEIRVACVGNVDAGKSTTLGVLTRGGLDDGRGKARVNLFRHKHEIETGRTSSVGMELLGLTAKGEHVMSAAGSKEEGRKLSWEEVCSRSAKIVNFLDLAGHERYLRTTIGGLTANVPEYGMLMVGANAGLIGMSKEHLGVALALSIPVFITVTKIDMCPPQILEATIKQLTKVLKSPGCRKTPVFVETMEQVVDCALRLSKERICPIFQISNVTGHNIPLLRTFLNILPQSSISKFDPASSFELQISDIFSVPFVGTVVSGVITGGSVKIGDNLLIGPDSLGQFIQTSVRSIQRKRVNVEAATAGQSASFALKRVRRNQVRKGMVMIARSDNPPQASLVFDAEILCLHHATTLSVGSCMVLHAAGIRQTVRITGIAKGGDEPVATSGPGTNGRAKGSNEEKPVIRTGDRARLRLQFIRTPEFIKVGVRLITREGRTRLIGRVAAVGGTEPLMPPSV
ncbi:P-loop containing nucleoside triphosphate hydrolase protein [Jaminaea rosea]|uniref:P-loop containing nucleoside triphosphate hydrolase protein n=1 Tax=Jaminaea rosea TaxID=1569628 RepID=A0A316UXE6_9BASI|nr:P-loop containing nucleoside triphosphate hydrolase protein [Jaminaea rosea]PWN28593.1 P-loop containing nucleoside triphosphate hydrolase protein [Jaminaea rosea]